MIHLARIHQLVHADALHVAVFFVGDEDRAHRSRERRTRRGEVKEELGDERNVAEAVGRPTTIQLVTLGSTKQTRRRIAVMIHWEGWECDSWGWDRWECGSWGELGIGETCLHHELEGIHSPILGIGGNHVHVAADESERVCRRSVWGVGARVGDNEVTPALGKTHALHQQRAAIRDAVRLEELEDVRGRQILLGEESLGRMVLEVLGLADELLQ